MAVVHTGASLVPTKLDLLQGWITDQRWYAGKGGTPALRKLTSWRLDDPGGEVGVETLILADDSGPAPVVYQVPLTYRAAPLPGGEQALIGTMEHSVLGTRYVYDGPHDPVYAAQLFALTRGEVTPAHGSVSHTPTDDVAGHGSDAEPLRLNSSRVLTGEQSNTSIIALAVDGAGSERPVITKVFRALAHGENPDVILQGALAAAGCTRVPASLGYVEGSWPAPDGGHAHGHLAFSQEFLPGAQDAWRGALVAAGTGTDFIDGARALGAATAEVHGILADHLPTEPATRERVTATVAGMRERFRAALAEVPALAVHAPSIEAILATAADAAWPDFQRIHGDYHLGQVLDVPGRGWVLLDFEGEPLRPLAERVQPDQPLRDVAGMLRSFDYAGGSVEQQTRGVSARAWVAAAQGAFLDGYASVGGADPRGSGPLLTAYLIDKALYEVVYEVRNRPAWTTIPLAAIERQLPSISSNKEEPS